MDVFLKLMDLMLLFFFLIVVVFAPLNGVQTVLPPGLFPDLLIRFNNLYVGQFDNYLLQEKPNFFIGFVWLELLCHWPLSLVNIYGILSNRSWVNTTCFMYGVSAFTCMVVMLSEMAGSSKASDRLKMVYFCLLGFPVLAILRGFIPGSAKNISAIDSKASIFQKKKA